ncbi:MAG: VOC family protein [marine benthic group bacterium]|jgi:predicted enzyme related to lactoylglutathione lyase|nr:VOC family protein [Gemmatimonadota bacterium]
MEGTTLGRFIWYDLMTTDPSAAQAFYGSVTGWGIEPFEGAQDPYDMWTRDGQPIGGVMELPEDARAAGAPSHWLAYIGTPDVDATTARAAELGATVLVPPRDIPTVGRFSVLSDPDGAVFATFAPASDMPPHPGMVSHGDFSWNELMWRDFAEGFEFYSDLFGWKKHEDMDMGEYGIYRIYGGDGPPLGGIMTRPPEMPIGAWLFYVTVNDIDAAVERVKAGGGQVLNGPMEVPGGDRVAQCQDPQGAMFALHWSQAETSG